MPDHPTLANAELAIMELLWDQPRLTARQIRERLYAGAPRAQHGTVQRLLQRLEDKGFVHRDRTLPVHVFAARVSREAYAGGQLESLAARLAGGSIASLLTHLVEHDGIDADELARLRALVDALPERREEGER